MLAGEGELVARRGDGDHPPAHELGDLDCRETRSSGGAEHRHGLARLKIGAILQAVQRRAIGDGNSGSHFVADAIRDGNDVPRLGDDFLPAAIAADKGDDPLPQLEIGDIGAEGFDAAGDFGSGREGKRRGDLVLVTQDQRVEEVEADRRHFDEDVVWARARLGHLLEAKRLRSAKFAELRHPHRSLLPLGDDRLPFFSHKACGRQGL